MENSTVVDKILESVAEQNKVDVEAVKSDILAAIKDAEIVSNRSAHDKSQYPINETAPVPPLISEFLYYFINEISK